MPTASGLIAQIFFFSDKLKQPENSISNTLLQQLGTKFEINFRDRINTNLNLTPTLNPRLAFDLGYWM